MHRNKTSSRVLDVSSQTRDDLNVPSCVTVVEDYDYEAKNGHDQDNLTDYEQAYAGDVKFGEALTYDQNRELQGMVQRFSDLL